jgi:uncharacterized protein YpmS
MSTSSKIKINMDSLKSRREWRRHKVKDGHNVYRVLPPFGEASNGYPYKKWQIIWGLFDPESGRSRPFASSLTAEKQCPITEYVQELKKRSEQIKAKLQSSGASEDTIKERLLSLNTLISDLSPKTVYIYNAIDKAGDVGLLELKSTAHKQMKAEMSSYIQDYNQDPTSLNSEDSDSGVWFDVTRQGLGFDTEYSVKRFQTKVKNATGKLTIEDDRSPLPGAVVENYANLAYDLSSVYQVKSYDSLKEILEANLPSIIETCPDADLDGSVAFETQVLSKPVAAGKASLPLTRAATTGSKPVTVRLDDEDDDATVLNSSTASGIATARAANVSMDSDFLAEAAALLNS